MTSPVVDQGRRGLRSWQAGLTLSLLGAALLVVGLVQTTSATQAPGCPSGTTLVAKFNYTDGGYVFEKPSGNAGIVSVSGSATDVTMTSSVPISAIIVKGGNDSIQITLSPPQSSASFSNAGLPLVGNGNTPAISNLQFCGPNVPSTPPTTTIVTTTEPPTSTSTSTEPVTTTSTSTTQPATTTSTSSTQPATTTSTSTTTTEPSSTTSTSTTQPATTTSTSTSAPATTTSTSTSTTEPTTTSTSTSAPATSTTSTGPATTTTAVEALPPGATTSTSSPVIGPPSTPPGGVVTSVAVLPPPASPTLPVTGTSSTPLIVLGLLILGAGVTLIIIGRARDRRIND